MNLLQRLYGAVIDACDQFGGTAQNVDRCTHRARMYEHPDGVGTARLEDPAVARASYQPEHLQTWPEKLNQQAVDADDDERRQRALESDFSPWIEDHRPTHEATLLDLSSPLHEEAPWPHEAHSPDDCHQAHELDFGPIAHDEELVYHHHDDFDSHHHHQDDW